MFAITISRLTKKTLLLITWPLTPRRWGCYGAYQRLLWHQIDSWRGVHRRSEGELLAVQASAGVITGFTSAALTNPLDVVKTQLQTREFVPGAAEQPTFSGVLGGCNCRCSLFLSRLGCGWVCVVPAGMAWVVFWLGLRPLRQASPASWPETVYSSCRQGRA